MSQSSATGLPPVAASNRLTASAAMTAFVLGIDVGGTKTAAVLFDEADRPVGRAQVVTPRRGLTDAVIDAAREALAQVPVGAGRLVGVGIAAPGQIDVAGGRIRQAVNLEEGELPIAGMVQTALGVPCFVEHDARAAAAWLFESPPDKDDYRMTHIAYLSMGTGISAGIVLDGVPVRGAAGLAGEIGHVSADPNGPSCGCGLRGCLEAVAAGPAIERRGRAAVEAGQTTMLADGPVTAEAVFRAAAAGDPVAASIATEVGAHVARAVRALVLMFGLERVYIGGGVVASGDAFIEPIERELERERASSSLIRHAVPAGVIRVVPGDTDPVAHGAAVIARAGIARMRPRMGP